MPDRICKHCRKGMHSWCVDEVPEFSVWYSPVNHCECANSTHTRHYDADGQLVLVTDA